MNVDNELPVSGLENSNKVSENKFSKLAGKIQYKHFFTIIASVIIAAIIVIVFVFRDSELRIVDREYGSTYALVADKISQSSESVIV